MNTEELIAKKNITIHVDKNILLKIIDESDITDKYVSWLNNNEVMQYTEQRFKAHTKETTLKFVKEKLNSKFDLLFGIFFKNNHIGNIKLGPINWDSLEASISFFIGEKLFWGKGITTNVIKKLTEYGFNKLNIKKIKAGYYEENIASSKIFKKCGFKITSKKVKINNKNKKKFKILKIILEN